MLPLGGSLSPPHGRHFHVSPVQRTSLLFLSPDFPSRESSGVSPARTPVPSAVSPPAHPRPGMLARLRSSRGGGHCGACPQYLSGSPTPPRSDAKCRLHRLCGTAPRKGLPRLPGPWIRKRQPLSVVLGPSHWRFRTTQRPPIVQRRKFGVRRHCHFLR